MSTPMTVDRSQSFEPDHQWEFLFERGDGSEVWRCDGSCGQENCTARKVFH